jgi:hypothetical protein
MHFKLPALVLLAVVASASIAAADQIVPPKGFQLMLPGRARLPGPRRVISGTRFVSLSRQEMIARARQLGLNVTQLGRQIVSVESFTNREGFSLPAGVSIQVDSATNGHIGSDGLDFGLFTGSDAQLKFQATPGTTYLADCAVSSNMAAYSIQSFYFFSSNTNFIQGVAGTQAPIGSGPYNSGHLIVPFLPAPSSGGSGLTANLWISSVTPGDWGFGGCTITEAH